MHVAFGTGQEPAPQRIARVDALNLEQMQGFNYISPVAEKLKEYEGKRKKFKSLGDFFPEIIKALNAMAEAGNSPQ